MELLNNLFGKTQNTPKKLSSPDNEPEHAVIIHFDYCFEGLDALYELEEILEQLILENDVGEYDGHEIATDYSDGILYMYGSNAERLFKTIEPTLKGTEFMKGAIVRLRFGPPEHGVKEIEVEI